MKRAPDQCAADRPRFIHRRGGIVAALAAGAALLALGPPGCAGSSRARTAQPAPAAHPEPDGVRFGPAYASLRKSAERAGPSRAASEGPPPRGLDPALAQPIPEGTPEGDRAREPLDRVLEELRAAERSPPDLPEVTPQEQQAALRRYVTGREKLLRGDARGAVEDLRSATRLDPAAPEPWRELGETQLAAGSPSEASVSFQAAVERGLRDARVLEFLGRLAEDRGEFERAAQWLASAESLNPRAEDPALPLVVRVGLGRCLIKMGRLEAGREALAGVLDLSSRPPAPTRYAQEVAAVYRRHGELWREVGDADCRLGRYDRALRAYINAALLPTVENVDLAPRVFFAANRSGRPAAAAVFVLDRIGANEGFVTSDDLELLSILAADRAVARDLARALAECRESLPPDAPPSLAGSLARARAAVLEGDAGRDLLRRHLAADPGNALAAGDLLGRVQDPVSEAAGLSSAHPEYADRYADATARAVPGADKAAESLWSLGGDGARLTSVYLLARVGRADEARQRAEGLRAGGAAGIEAEVARARLSAAQGRWADAERALAAIGSGPDGPWARVRALWALRQPDDALGELRALLGTSGAGAAVRFDRLILGAELASRSGQPQEAERFAREAARLDRCDDRPYSVLLSLYSPGGALADPDKLAAALRDLRGNVPDSRLVAFLRAQEFLRRSFLKPAERELLRLAEPDPSDGTVLEMLSGVWTRMGPRPDDPDFAAAVAWLDEQSRTRPWADTLVAAKARVLASAGMVDQAESMLRERLGTRPTPEVARLLEILLRERGKGEEADRLAEERLAESPLSIDEAVELAELRARQERDADAADSIRTNVPPGAALENDQVNRVLAAATLISERAQGGREASREAAVWLLDDLVRRHARLTPELHERRLILLAATPDADDERLLRAADEASREYPQLGAAPYLRLSQALEERGRDASALRLIERAAAAEKPSPDVLAEWLRLVIAGGGAEEARRAIERAGELGQASALVERVVPPEQRDDADKRNPRAVLAYQLAIRAAVLGRDGAAEDLYELCLEYDPGHPWANNNLGYSLVERGEDLEPGGRAERLLVKAYEALPDSASIMDSLAWLRYKQGVLTDVSDESGRTVRRGAVPLLQAATQTPEGQGNQTILDHCGDALWVVGRKEEARRMWDQSARRASDQLSEIRRLPEDHPRQRARPELNQLRASVRRKIEAADRGQEPAVAPRTGDSPAAPGSGE